jgi:hypothetical protein
VAAAEQVEVAQDSRRPSESQKFQTMNIAAFETSAA